MKRHEPAGNTNKQTKKQTAQRVVQTKNTNNNTCVEGSAFVCICMHEIEALT